MNRSPLKVLLVDEGKNTGLEDGSKIGGGQIARRRFFSNADLFHVTLLTSEEELVKFWHDHAENIMFAPDLSTYRPTRTKIARYAVKWPLLFKEGRRAAMILANYLQNGDYDVLFFNDTKSRLLYILALINCKGWKLKGRRSIEVDGEWTLGFCDFLMKNLYLVFFDKIICPTESVKKRLGPLRHLYKRKLFTAFPGVDLPETFYACRHSPTGQKNLSLGCVGTLRIESKAQDLIVNAVDRLVKKCGSIPVKVLFFGDGPDRNELEKMIQGKGLDSYFEFKGYVSEQNEIYNQIEACILSSRTEVAPLVLMECLVRNIPVIASDLDGCKEILSHFYNELLFRQGDDHDLARVLEQVLRGDVLQNINKKLKNMDKQIITRDYQVRRLFDFLRS
jgi:glycosyltransferase involved in cell wall biosynthesis